MREGKPLRIFEIMINKEKSHVHERPVVETEVIVSAK